MPRGSKKCLPDCLCDRHLGRGGQAKGSIPWNKGKPGTQQAWNKGRLVPEMQKAKQKATWTAWFEGLDDKTRKEVYGREQTPELRRRLSKALKGNQVLSDLMTERRRDQPEKFRGGGQFKAGRRSDLDNLYVRSKWEANYARILNVRLSLGEISEWQYEPRRFMFDDINRGTRSYLPDFWIRYPDGHEEYHEVKGWWTPRAKTAVKRFLKRYPEYTLVIVEKAQYKDLTLQYSELISEWEK